MTYDELMVLAHAAASQGCVLKTVTDTEFSVGVYLECPFFIPASTGRGRSDGRKAVERFLDRYSETHSLRPADYSGVTRNASYLIGLILAADELA
ncbi:MAG: hypothetical protein ABJH68_21565 [Ilumatobacter sp.]|uniref:hypothetical protein n=1 Tax=Ilumatobacter sp. TaxID=1967498 RepID=UPI0032979F5A